jgi:hypothetical protein
VSIVPVASYPEQYERFYRELWDVICDPPISWGRAVAEARELARSLEEDIEADRPSASRPEASEVLRMLRGDFGEALADVPVTEGFDPRLSGVFAALPVGTQLRNAYADFLQDHYEYHGRNVPDDDAALGAADVEVPVQQAMIEWAHYGRRVYMLGRHTAELLARTDLPAMPIGELHFPFASFYIRVPHGMYSMHWDEKLWDVDGVLVATNRTEDDSFPARELKLIVCPDRVYSPGPFTPIGIATEHRSVTLTDVAGRLEGQLHDRQLGLFRVDDLNDPLPNLVIGFLLYLMSEHPQIEPVEAPTLVRSSRTSRRPRADGKATRPRIGYVKIGVDWVGSSPQGEPVATLTKMIWVRGHWRRQAHGPKHQLRRTIWIEPHVRGPDLAEQVDARPARIPAAQRRDD